MLELLPAKFRVRVVKVVVVEELGECWQWIGTVKKDTGNQNGGYGAYGIELAHKYAYEFFNGPVKEGFELDHLCRNRGCANPTHVEEVTHFENCRRGTGYGANANKTHCPQGHEYTIENTQIVNREFRDPSRMCRICMRNSKLSSYYRRKNLNKSLVSCSIALCLLFLGACQAAPKPCDCSKAELQLESYMGAYLNAMEDRGNLSQQLKACQDKSLPR